uniref:ATP synthase complex subunit 8 n=1 Tax=Ochrogaster lunifer TaxID=319761 RepID=B4F331_OCHLU|nr:ATP synthase F0 subunit 8 [Ochrogaster lunifer]CAQ19282.1 ATP synthase F0 subunit 8 [Ochrogaster lunifer]
MPQMMPINWFISLFFFIYIFYIFNMMNYFIFNYKKNLNYKSSPLKNKQFFWKW